MYNDIAKRKFVNDVYSGEQVRKNITRLLERISVYESDASKDLCEFSVEELAHVIDGVAGISPRSIVQTKSIIASYLAYSGSTTSRTSIMSINIDNSDKITNQMVRDASDLHSLLTFIFPPEDIITRNTLYRCFIWLAFSGIDIDDVSSVRVRDVNFYTGQICFGGDVYPIYDESIEDLRSACKASALYEHIKEGKYWPTERVGNDFVLRGTSDLSGLYQRMRSAMARLITFRQKETGLTRKITYRKSYLSGVFSRAISQTTVSPEEYVKQVRVNEMRRKCCRDAYEPSKREFNAGVKAYVDAFHEWHKAFY